MYPFSCVLWAIFWAPVLRQIARYLPHHRSENASKTHPKASHDKFKTASEDIHLFLFIVEQNWFAKNGMEHRDTKTQSFIF